MSECYRCGQEGHFARDCPTLRNVAPLPPDQPDRFPHDPWCGRCDRRTRLVDFGDYMQRCPECHSLRHKPLPQHKICGGCGEVIYAWDALRCADGHQKPVVYDWPVIRQYWEDKRRVRRGR